MTLLSSKGRILEWKALEVILPDPFILYMRNQVWTIDNFIHQIFLL